MNKRHFQTTSILLSGILVILGGLQVFWLQKMYDSRSGEFMQKINAAAEQAAYQYVTQIKRKIPTVTGKIQLDSLKASQISFITLTDSTVTDPQITDSIKHSKVYSYKIVNAPSAQDIRITKITMNFIKETESVAIYDTLFSQNLREREVWLPHGIRFRKGEKDTLIGTRVANPLTLRLPLKDIIQKDLFLEIENPNRELLKEMAGIILSSLFILLVLIGSFYYLLRTIFRQKTLEELKSDFTRNITHELKTPLSVASAANEALLHYGAADDPQKRDEYLRATRQQLALLSNMVERILSMTRQEQDDYPLHWAEHNLGDILQELVQNHSLQYASDPQKRVIFRINLPAEGMRLRIDRFHFTNVLNNLIDNAIKYSGETPVVEITASAPDSGSASGSNPAAQIRISDNGPGIPDFAVKRIFDKFYRIPTGNLHAVKGFGLGLYYSRIIVEKHGGTLEVKSRSGAGCTFIISLPGH